MSSDKVKFTDIVISEKSFNGKTYTNCSFETVSFENCSFKNVRFVDCYFENVDFNYCTSHDMVLNGCFLWGSVFLETKLKSTTIENTNIQDSRFYNNIFLETTFENNKISETIIENSSFVKTSMLAVIMRSVSIISTDFRNSSFTSLIFADDVDIQESNFGNCKFSNSSLQICYITDTIFDDSHFSDVDIGRVAVVKDCSFENVTNKGTDNGTDIFFNYVVSHSEYVSRVWKTVKLDISGAVSERQQTLSGTKFRSKRMISREYFDKDDQFYLQGIITHMPYSIKLNQFDEIVIDIPANQIAHGHNGEEI